MLPLSVSALSALGASLCLLPCLSRTSITCHKRRNFNIKYEHFISKDMIGRAAKGSEASLHGVDILDSFLTCSTKRKIPTKSYTCTTPARKWKPLYGRPIIHKLLLHTAWVASSSWISKGSPPEMAQSNTIFHYQRIFLASENP